VGRIHGNVYKNVMSHEKRTRSRTHSGLRPRVPDREFVECIRNTCGRHSTICVRSKSFPHMRDIQPCIQHPREQAHRDNQHPTSRDVTINPNAPAACSVAANTIPCPPWLPTPRLPILNPSRSCPCRCSIPPMSLPKAPHSRPPVHVRRVHNPKSTSALGLYS
jgi:hypothetical protein